MDNVHALKALVSHCMEVQKAVSKQMKERDSKEVTSRTVLCANYKVY